MVLRVRHGSAVKRVDVVRLRFWVFGENYRDEVVFEVRFCFAARKTANAHSCSLWR